jgi:hypothetical protein
VQEALCRFKRYITMTDYSDVHVTFRMNDITRKSSSDHRKMISVVYMMVYMMR